MLGRTLRPGICSMVDAAEIFQRRLSFLLSPENARYCSSVHNESNESIATASHAWRQNVVPSLPSDANHPIDQRLLGLARVYVRSRHFPRLRVIDDAAVTKANEQSDPEQGRADISPLRRIKKPFWRRMVCPSATASNYLDNLVEAGELNPPKAVRRWPLHA